MASDGAVRGQEPKATSFGKLALGFSPEQKYSCIQSIVQSIPRERPLPWNAVARPISTTTKYPSNEQVTDVTGTRAAADTRTVNRDIMGPERDTATTVSVQEPPLIDPYEKSMVYYEKHLVLNHFQVSPGIDLSMCTLTVQSTPVNVKEKNFMCGWG